MITLQTHRTHNAARVRVSAGLKGSSPDRITMGNDPKEDSGDLLLLAHDTKVKRPPMFKVIVLNDDYTPMDFVVIVLKQVFRMPHEDAISTMLHIHHQGSAECGTFTRDVAETKMEQVALLAREHEYPLQCRMEQA